MRTRSSDLQFSLVIFNSKSLDLAIRRLSAYLFIYLFNFNFLGAVQLRCATGQQSPQVGRFSFFVTISSLLSRVRSRLISLMGRVFANGPGALGSIPGCVVPKTSKIVPPCLTLSNIRYVSRVKWSNPGKRAAPSPTSRCSSY